MKDFSMGRKLASFVCLLGGAALLVTALVLDATKSGAVYRGAFLVLGVVGMLVGLFIFPTLKYHRALMNFVFLFPLLFAFLVTVIIPLVLGIRYSFTNWDGIRYTKEVGFDNYIKMFLIGVSFGHSRDALIEPDGRHRAHTADNTECFHAYCPPSIFICVRFIYVRRVCHGVRG